MDSHVGVVLAIKFKSLQPGRCSPDPRNRLIDILVLRNLPVVYY